MLRVTSPAFRHCDRLTRRDFLRVGGLGLGNLTLASLLAQEARGQAPARKKSVIYVCLSGGPSHVDMYDMKPHAPDTMRSPFRPVATNLPGVHICEHMPLQTTLFDKMTLVRGIRSVENDHFLSEVYTGLPRTAGARPAFGSVVSKLSDPRESLLPPYVCLDRETVDRFEFQKPHYAGAAHVPFRPFGDAVKNLTRSAAVSLERLHDRRGLLKSFDTLRRDIDAAREMDGIDAMQGRALEIVASDQVRDAFDVSREPDRVRERYGKGKWTYNKITEMVWDNTPLLQARRLVEAGVRVVTVSLGSWDHHGGDALGSIFDSIRSMMPNLDRGLHALVTDLYDRGLDQDVLVVVLGEFGRDPRIDTSNGAPGRGHWAPAGCGLFIGGGLKMGQVIGETDSKGAEARVGAVGFQNVLATVYTVLGIDPATQLADFNGRPTYLLDERAPITELF